MADIQELSAANFDTEVLQHDGRVLVDFYTDWCSPCKQMAPVLEEIAASDDSVKIVKVDAGKEQQLALQHEATMVPTFVLFENGNKVRTTVGAMPKAKFVDWLNG